MHVQAHCTKEQQLPQFVVIKESGQEMCGSPGHLHGHTTQQRQQIWNDAQGTALASILQ